MHPILHPRGCILSHGEAGFWCWDAEGTLPCSSLLSAQTRTCFHTWYEFSRRQQCGNVQVSLIVNCYASSLPVDAAS